MRIIARARATCITWFVVICPAAFCMPSPIQAQGEVHVSNRASSVDAPIYDVDRVTLLSGDGFAAQFYAAPFGSASLEPVGRPADFSVQPGYFWGGVVTLQDVPYGGHALGQVKAWRLSDGDTFDEAFHPGGHVGASPYFDFFIPGPGGPEALLQGLKSFSLYVVPVPEPATAFLAVVGLVVLAGVRKVVSTAAERRHESSDIVQSFRYGNLWTCQHVGLDNTNGTYNGDETGGSVDRSGIQWWKLKINSSGTPLTYDASGIVYDDSAGDPWWYYTPSLAINWMDEMVLGFSGSKTNEYVGAFYTGRFADGTMLGSVSSIHSGSVYFYSSDFPVQRWGDYSYTTIDPVDNQTFWTVQEAAYITDPVLGWPTWVTWIGKINPSK